MVFNHNYCFLPVQHIRLYKHNNLLEHLLHEIIWEKKRFLFWGFPNTNASIGIKPQRRQSEAVLQEPDVLTEPAERSAVRWATRFHEHHPHRAGPTTREAGRRGTTVLPGFLIIEAHYWTPNAAFSEVGESVGETDQEIWGGALQQLGGSSARLTSKQLEKETFYDNSWEWSKEEIFWKTNQTTERLTCGGGGGGEEQESAAARLSKDEISDKTSSFFRIILKFYFTLTASHYWAGWSQT